VKFVTIDQARAHCQASPADDTMLALYAGAAEQSAVDFLDRQVFVDQDTLDAAVEAGTAGDDPMVVNDAIRAAVLLVCAHLYANKEEVVAGSNVAAVALPFGAERLLWPHRSGLGV
jgi:hypothetical protein